VLVIDKRPHIAGNAYDHLDEAGVADPPIWAAHFHEQFDEIVDYLSQIHPLAALRHRVLGDCAASSCRSRSTDDAKQAVRSRSRTDEEAAPISPRAPSRSIEIRTSEDVVVSRSVASSTNCSSRAITRKQWGIDPSQLDKWSPPASRRDEHRRPLIFGDKHQIMPPTAIRRCSTRCSTIRTSMCCSRPTYKDVVDEIGAGHRHLHRPIDEYFGFRYGKLPIEPEVRA
jgi:UDP-galactopyranose mutase